MSIKMKRILVTGGAGFLGSHICEKLVYEGHDVICIDNLTTGYKKNIEELLPKYNFEFIRHDITQPIILEVDQIYNLACPASPVHYQSDPVQTLKANVHGSINMLGLAKRTGAKILQASTSYASSLTMNKLKEDYSDELNLANICPTTHSSELNEIFFETIDHMDCHFDPMSIHR